MSQFSYTLCGSSPEGGRKVCGEPSSLGLHSLISSASQTLHLTELPLQLHAEYVCSVS